MLTNTATADTQDQSGEITATSIAIGAEDATDLEAETIARFVSDARELELRGGGDRRADQGVKTRSQSSAQARRMLARQRHALPCWMSSPLPKLDPNNPFGGRNGDPGRAPAHAHAPVIPGCGGCCSD